MERVFVVTCGHQHDSNQYVGVYNETDIVSKSLCDKIPSKEVEYCRYSCPRFKDAHVFFLVVKVDLSSTSQTVLLL